FSSNFFHPFVEPSSAARSPRVIVCQPVDCCTTPSRAPPPHSVYLRTSLQDELLTPASDDPQVLWLLFHVVPELTAPVRCSSVVHSHHDQECSGSALKVAPSTCLPRQLAVSSCQIDRYTMFCGSLVKPTFACEARS